jgi:hypothetical protein
LLIAVFVVEGVICGLRNGFAAGELTVVERTVAASTALDISEA